MFTFNLFQEKCEDVRAQLNNEIKEREEADAEVGNWMSLSWFLDY